ncbi:MAG: hypothetical protein MZU91_11160 [Desulfosudis oleivorans]|nr:hypothetical protein [Desulfosudis oleivorans]
MPDKPSPAAALEALEVPKIDRVDLVTVRLPFVAPVRHERLHLDGQGSDADAPRVGRRRRLERVRLRPRPVLLLRDQRRPPATSSRTSCCRWSSRASRSASSTGGSAASAATAWPRRRSRTACSSSIALQQGVPLHELLGRPAQRIPSGLSIGLKETQDELLAAVEQAVARKLPPGQDEGQEGPGRRLGPRRARPLPGRCR